ncbi:hypothetical protein EYF80_025219 [Liparis tanakae]|uniref:Uncharacterized protein n=1 Tax=Liparis tanakae TaxID=230148 RepID=A0A4Z2HIB6_9TELE|nr:hypothetical protein EYF80_025219 [Liparis tanakae]
MSDEAPTGHGGRGQPRLLRDTGKRVWPEHLRDTGSRGRPALLRDTGKRYLPYLLLAQRGEAVALQRLPEEAVGQLQGLVLPALAQLRQVLHQEAHHGLLQGGQVEQVGHAVQLQVVHAAQFLQGCQDRLVGVELLLAGHQGDVAQQAVLPLLVEGGEDRVLACCRTTEEEAVVEVEEEEKRDVAPGDCSLLTGNIHQTDRTRRTRQLYSVHPRDPATLRRVKGMQRTVKPDADRALHLSLHRP